MKKLILVFVAFASIAFGQAQVCVQDTIYAIGVPNLTPATGFIDLYQGYVGTNGVFVITSSQGRLTITNGVVNTCQAAASQIQAAYSIKKTGPVAGYNTYTRVWNIPALGGPYTVQQVEQGAVSLSWTSPGVFCDATGAAANTLVCPGVPVPVAYVPGLVVSLRVDGTNTGATTLAINTLGVMAINNGGLPLGAGALAVGAGTGNIYQLTYDGTRFNILNTQVPSIAGQVIGNLGGTVTGLTGVTTDGSGLSATGGFGTGAGWLLTNSTLAGGAAFQQNSSNAATTLAFYPNGSSMLSQLTLNNGADLTNTNINSLRLFISGPTAAFMTHKRGTGSTAITAFGFGEDTTATDLAVINFQFHGITRASLTNIGLFNAAGGFATNGIAGFSGTKTGACTFVIAGGLITNVTGC